MPAATFVASALVTLCLASAFLLVAAKVHRRSRKRGQPDLAWFALFWAGVGAYGLAESLWALGYLAGLDALAVGLLVLHVKLIASVSGFAGLLCYLLAIHGRDGRVRAALLVAYAAILALVETFYSWRGPLAQEPGQWGMRLLYAQNDTQPWWTLVLLLLFLPPFLGALSYASLLRHAREPELRYRIALTSASLLLFFLPLFLGWQAGGAPWWGGVEKALSALMALGIVLALWPPAGVRRWLAGRGVADPGARDRALLERARQLV